MAAAKIHDYAVIGDCLSAALVSRSGSIDWLCWPRFDSPSVFGALLGDGAGAWRVAPAGVRSVTRRYVPDTNVLETRFETGSGVLLLTDAMSVASEDDNRERLLPEREIVRVATCERGEVDLESFFDPRPLYGAKPPAIRRAGGSGLRVETREGLLSLRTDLEIDGDDPRRARGRLRAGDRRHFSLVFAVDSPAVLPPVGEPTRDAVERSIAWWRAWASGVKYDGPERPLVLRSALALRLLFFAPSGAIVAAPTTSLPERVGGDLNWDYRFCWLRDASLTVRALFGLGCEEEAAAFVSWLHHSTRLSWPEFRVLYDVYGNASGRERLLDLPGYAGSRPVRVGNAAAHQLQLDVYGEVIEAAARFATEGGTFDRETHDMLRATGEWVCRNWERPDEGIWEPRETPAPHTHSRLLCWTALECLLALHERRLLKGLPVDKFRENREMIRREIEARAWSAELGSYVATLDGADLDAALLLMTHHGFEHPASPRMRSTYERVRRELGAGRGLLYRHRRPPDQAEGAFVICSFWATEYLAMGGGTLEEAETLFDDVCSHANDVGLLAEEIDPETGDALGNFPQGFSHIGLINAALTLARRREREEVGA